MRYKPIESRSDALDRIAGLGYGEFSIVSYEENWQREQGEPDIEITRDAEYAVDFAVQSARYALIAAMTAIDLQMTLEEQTGGKPS